MARRKDRFVVDLQKVGWAWDNRGVELRGGDLRPVPLRTTRFDVERSEQPEINLSSIAGRFGFAMRTPYSAAKWAVVGFTQSLAVEAGPDKVRVNCIQPGIVGIRSAVHLGPVVVEQPGPGLLALLNDVDALGKCFFATFAKSLQLFRCVSLRKQSLGNLAEEERLAAAVGDENLRKLVEKAAAASLARAASDRAF